MLWIQYEATQEVDSLFIRDVVRTVGEYISPHPVAALDEGQFGVGAIVCDILDSSSSSDTSNDRLHPSPRISQDSLNEIHNAPWKYATTRQPRGANSGTSNSKGGATHRNRSHVHRGNKRSRVSPDGKSAEDDSMEGQDDDNDGEEEGEETPPPKRPRKEGFKNDRFTGTAILCVGNSLFQELSISFGLRIKPRIGSGFADCQIILDPITVRASTLFSDDDKSIGNSSIDDHFYVTEQANIRVGAHKGVCDPPVYVHPLQQHFAERRSVSTRNQFDVSFEASVSPKFVIKGSKGNGNTVEYDPITLSLQPVFIGPAARNDFQWQYRLISPYGTNLEMSSANPPIHKATYRVSASDPPSSMKVITEAIFRKNKRVGKRRNLSETFRSHILQNIEAMHLIATLEINIGNGGNDWFLFPSSKKEGCRLQRTVNLDGKKTIIQSPVVQSAGEITSKLSCKAAC